MHTTAAFAGFHSLINIAVLYGGERIVEGKDSTFRIVIDGSIDQRARGPSVK